MFCFFVLPFERQCLIFFVYIGLSNSKLERIKLCLTFLWLDFLFKKTKSFPGFLY